eukprot:m.175459 g.175459  ORF g.175459 m.175459 type:complete len:883 (+) comp16780_c0_seq1:82-2730(+)
MFSFLNADSADRETSGAEAVDKLVARLNSAVMLDDRRGAVLGLRSLSKEYQVDVGSQAMDALIDVLRNDRADTEITTSALEALINVTKSKKEGDNSTTTNDDDVGVMFTEIFVKNVENVLILLILLEEVDFYVRFNTVKLLTVLLGNRPRQLQSCIMQQPVGVSRLMDLLKDKREVIRNEGLLLMINLTKSNANIQKIVAFENAFELALSIIAEEGQSEGGIIVEDCVTLMTNLLDANVSNQNYFRETSCVALMAPFFKFNLTPPEWPLQARNNIKAMLQVVRLLVAPDNPPTARTAAQTAAAACGLLNSLVALAFASTLPDRSLAMSTLAEVIRGHNENQTAYAALQPVPNTPSVLASIGWAFKEDAPFDVRAAAVYSAIAYLHLNNSVQSSIVQSLLPGSSSPFSNVAVLLCQGLLAPQLPITTWVSAMVFTQLLVGNSEAKETLMQVVITREATEPESLLSICTSALAQSKQQRQRVGMLVTLIAWLHDSPAVVKAFLGMKDIMGFLVTLTHDQDNRALPMMDGLCCLLLGVCMASNDNSHEQHDRNAFMQIIQHRIGGEDEYLGRLEQFLKCEELTVAANTTAIVQDEKMSWFHQDLAVLLQDAVRSVKACVTGKPMTSSSRTSEPKTAASVSYHNSVVDSYKEFIRSQDEELQQLRKQLEQINLGDGSGPAVTSAVDSTATAAVSAELETLKHELATVQAERDSLAQVLSQQTSTAQTTGEGSDSSAELIGAKAELEQLRMQVQMMQANSATDDSAAELQAARADLIHLQEENQALHFQINALQDQQLHQDSDASISAELAQAQEQAKRSAADYAQLNEMHEDLLVLLSTQHETIGKYRQRLLALGEAVSDDELDTTVEGGQDDDIDDGSLPFVEDA